jgi:hypothetical protein
MRLIIATACAMLSVAATPALAYNWMYIEENKSLIGSTGEEEGDTDFRATCKASGKAEIGIGAAQDVGTGEGEGVSVKLTAGKRVLTIQGLSGQSPNFQMTGGVELQTQVDGKHEIFQLLADKGTIKMSGGKRAASWLATGRAAATKTFMKACFGG